MTSYMSSYFSHHNPITKRITDFLSQYLDLQPPPSPENPNDDNPNSNNHNNNKATTSSPKKTTTTQTKTTSNHNHKNHSSSSSNKISWGIWSGHLSLHHVKLRNDTMNQFLDQYINHPSASSSSNTKKRPSRRNTSSSKPRYQLISGTIGSLQIQIPWKQFLSGNNNNNNNTAKKGTQVLLQNVVLVVTLDHDHPSSSYNTENEKDDEEEEEEENDENTMGRTFNEDPVLDGGTSSLHHRTLEERRRARKQKQYVLQDIERRLLLLQSKKKNNNNTHPRSTNNNDDKEDHPNNSTSISDYIAQVRQREKLLQEKRQRRTTNYRPSNNHTTTGKSSDPMNQNNNNNNTDNSNNNKSTANAVLRRNEYWLSSYLRNLTKDLFYTLLINLSVQIDHLQIIMILPQQYHHHPSSSFHSNHNRNDPMATTTPHTTVDAATTNTSPIHFLELGCIIPSIHMTNDGQMVMSSPMMVVPPDNHISTTNTAVTTTAMGTNSSDSDHPNQPTDDNHDDDDEGVEEVFPTTNHDPTTPATQPPPTTSSTTTTVVDPIEKYIQIKSIGCYIRTGTTTTAKSVVVASPISSTTPHHRNNHYSISNPFLNGTVMYPLIPDVQTKDYMIRPFDIDFHGTVYIPSATSTSTTTDTSNTTTLLQDRKRKNHTLLLQRATTIATTTISTTNSTSTSTTNTHSGPTPKRKRRGKRDKDEDYHPTTTATTTTKKVVVHAPTTTTSIHHDDTNLSSSIPTISQHSNNTSRSGGNDNGNVGHRRIPTWGSSSPAAARRRMSWMPLSRYPPPTTTRSTLRTSTMDHTPLSLRRNSTLGPTNTSFDEMNDVLPLAQPNDLGAYYIQRKRSNLEDGNNNISSATGMTTTKNMTTNNNYTELNGKLSIGAVHAVCTSTHYKLLNDWNATTIQLRNGRPFVSIRTVLRQQLQRMMEDQSSSSKFVLATDPTANESQPPYNPQVQVWWHYIYGVIVQELRERKRTRVMFQKMFLSFDWSKQSRYRSEYIKAFIQCRLQTTTQKSSSTMERPVSIGIRSVTFGTATPSKSMEERLMFIEDILPVEQLILYRSIARKIYAKGFIEMPLSFLEVNANADVQNVNDNMDVSIHSNKEADVKMEPQVKSGSTSLLSTLTNICEITRARCYSTIGGVIPEYPPEIPKPPRLNAATVGEDSKLGWRSDTSRTSKANRTTTSHTDRSYGGVASTAMEHICNSAAMDSKNFKMIYTFAVHIQKVELLVMEEESFLKNSSQSSDNVQGNNTDDDDDTNRSLDNISLLTDDDVRSLQPGNWNANGGGETETVDPISSSTDYLLFEIPKRVLLQFEMTQLTCSLLGDTSDSRCLSFRIGQVKAAGEDNMTLMLIGQGNMAPLGEVVISSDGGAVKTKPTRRSSIVMKDALVLSLVISSNHTFLQCDAPTIRVFVDVSTLKKLVTFHRVNAACLPKSLLDRQPREKVRLYVLKQHRVEFPDLNCSVRIQGCELSLLHEAKTTGSTTISVGNSMTETLSQMMIPSSAATVRCNMIEMYSGTTVLELSDLMDEWQNDGNYPSNNIGVRANMEPSNVTRRLSMLDLPALMAERPSMLSFHSVVAMSGIDVVLSPSSSIPLSLFNDTLSIEVLYSLNSESLLNLNEAKETIVAEVSPVHILISEERILGITRSNILDQFRQLSTLSPDAKNENDKLPPRLEVLSSFLHSTLLLSIRAMRVSVLSGTDHGDDLTSPTHKVVMDDIMSDFLNVISVYDINFPHEDAVDAAMTICINRLVGIGISADDAWEATNLLVLHFLDEVEGQDPHESRHVIDIWGYDQRSHKIAIEKAVFKTSALLLDQLDHIDYQYRRKGDICVEFPGGISVSSVSLFYDHHFKIVLPSLLFGNTDGLHFLRIAPHESSPDTFKVTSDDTSENSSHGGGGSAIQNSIQHGTLLQVFSLDKGFRFGKGGFPLSSLGSDTIVDVAAENRIREHLLDFTIGDLEIMFSSAVSIDAIRSIERLLKPLQKLLDKSPSQGVKRASQNDVTSEVYVFAKASSLSSLFLSDALEPFIRFLVCDFVALSRRVKPLINVKEMHEWNSHFFSQSIRLVNLTREGQLFPEIIEPLPSNTSHCISVSIDATSGINIKAKNLRLCVLRQFLNEAIQYFVTPQYGLGLLLHHLYSGGSTKNGNDISKKQTLVMLHDISIIVPRSCYCYDMACVEVTKVLLTFSRPKKSFRMPSSSASLIVMDDEIRDDVEGDLEESISRLKVCLCGFKIYSALPDKIAANVRFRDSPSFRSTFALNGRAEAMKHVFIPINSDKTEVDDAPESHYDEKANRYWREITSVAASVAIFVDKGPHLRVLITDYSKDHTTGLHVKVNLSQFCLLQSIWFSNMQELPQLFPYSTMSLRQGSGPLEVLRSVPDHGSAEFRSFLKAITSVSTEIAVILKDFSMKCIFDGPSDNSDHQISTTDALCVEFGGAVVHVTTDRYGIVRIGVGCKSVSLTDESTVARLVLSAEAVHPGDAWADLAFGIDQATPQPSTCLSQALQMSIFLTPGWNVYNLGLSSPRIILSDLAPIFKLLKFLSAYSSDAAFGNPSFDTSERVQKIKNELFRNTYGHLHSNSCKNVKSPSMEFRLWLRDPSLSIPFDRSKNYGPCLRVDGEGGLRYTYLTIHELSSQECVADCLNFTVDGFVVIPSEKVRYRNSARKLVENLCFGFRFDTNSATRHADVCIDIPFVDTAAPDTYSSRICLSPNILPLPMICSPYVNVTRSLGRNVCEMTCIVDVLPMVTTVLLQLFSSGDYSADSIDSNALVEAADARTTKPQAIAENNIETYSMVASITDVRIYMLDPILGPHLPIAVLSISSTSLSASQFAKKKPAGEMTLSDFQAEDLQISVNSTIWADYFKLGMTRSWEPLLEPYRFKCDVEKSGNRGSGLTFNSDSYLHLNISSALLMILDEVADELYRMVKGCFNSDLQLTSDCDNWELGQVSDRTFLNDSFEGKGVSHEYAASVEDEDRVAFSIRNMTGQKLRIVRPTPASLSVLYLQHAEAAELKFPASISIVKNLRMTEVKFPGLPNDLQHRHVEIKKHTVDIQLPGFKWLEAVVVDTFGRKFAKIVPLSKTVQSKIVNDWKVENILHLLIEVGLRNGGRQVTVRSVISVVNKTKHTIGILLHPDPLFSPDEREQLDAGTHIPKGNGNKLNHYDADYNLAPGEWFQVPTLLLESSLRQSGIHLGRMWIQPTKPKLGDGLALSDRNKFCGIHTDDEIDFSSRPIPFTRLVNESANMFESSRFRDIASDCGKSKLQLSCPVTNHSGERVAPLCYAIEIDRSPIVRDRTNSKQSTGPRHLPVAYSIMIHPPIVIANQLPCEGRFELMHAVNRAVLWSGDLKPGQEVSVHSVGLDVPLFLFLNIGFAKTPVGEGALVHHGPDPPPNIRDNLVSLKTIGKAGKAVTKSLGRTLTSIGESSDTRGLKRIFRAQNQRRPSPNDNNIATHNEMKIKTSAEGDEVDGKTYKIDNFHYFADDVAQHTTIVDGLGQRLTLSIENIRGGGGQRRVTVFCRFWIVNTTEHCLRYKQENTNTFVSGTVMSPDKDGSLPLSGARSQPKYGKHTDDTEYPCNEAVSRRLYAGLPGALASFPGRCEQPAETVAALLDSNMPIEDVAKWSFMFSFQDDHVNIGNHRMCVQLWDGTGCTRYISDWSRGFGVDSVGVAQTISLHCKDGRAVELNVVVTVATGALANYTSIIRILPRYAIVNNLPYPVRIWQDNSTFSTVAGGDLTSKKALKWRNNVEEEDRARINQYELLWGRPASLNEREKSPSIGGTAARRSALYITTVYPSEILPFCLPDSRGERQLRIDPGNPWDLSGSISTNKPGDFTLAIKQAVDSKAISHESSRASPHYEVRLPPHGTVSFDDDLGIWFESDYGVNTGLIVKAVRKNSYTFNETEVHVGDELLYLNGTQLNALAFDEAIELLKRHLLELKSKRRGDGNAGTPIKHGRQSLVQKSLKFLKEKDQSQRATDIPSMVLTFRTVEERIRRVMINASTTDTTNVQSLECFEAGKQSSVSRNRDTNESGFFIHAELKNFPRSHLGLFLVLREENTAPYELFNQSVFYTIYYRQRDCSHLKWQSLKPGESRRYAWDEPLKPKKLVLRVDSQNMFAYGGNSSRDTLVSDNPSRISASTRLRSEEDVYFPKSALIPLDEVGYHEVLSLQDASMRNENVNIPLSYLQFDVDVSRNSRVLVVADVPSEEGQRQMVQWLDDVNEKLKSETTRQKDLQAFTETNAVTRTEDAYKRFIEACNVQDHGGHDDVVISACHQIFVEILEATGISSDSINASCHPYCDVRLKHGHNRNRLFGSRDRRQTYYIRNTLTPVWNKQSFVFQVPQEASTVTRGYKLVIRVRNYSTFRFHQVLGYARIDLHSVRDQRSHIGWFPLVGRNGRPELNTHGSHLGRGSIRVRVQWIYSMPALLQYFVILSENRIILLQERKDIITRQVERLVESENGMRAGQDGIQAVRIDDLISFPKYKRKENIDNLRLQKVKASMIRKNTEPLILPEESTPLNSPTDSQDRFTELPVLLRPHKHENAFTKTANPLHAIAHRLEQQISQKRLQRLNTGRQLLADALNPTDGIVPLSLIRSWHIIQALLNDADVEAKFNGDNIEATLRPNLFLQAQASTCEDSEVMNDISSKLRAPDQAPPSMKSSINGYIDDWMKSRTSFERSARISMKTVLHSGGWLSIRPITALNLPDVFTGMAVKIQYGSETYISDTADVRSLDPSWYKMNRRDSSVDDWELVSHNDIHIHIAPQLTSGTIRLSVIGEKKHKRPSSKTEIGVVHLPVGATLSCLLDCEESRVELLRWFPLSTSTARMEGDGGLSVRPPDTEKDSDSEFKEYFAPCIQLALFWSSDSGDVVDKTENDSIHEVSHTQEFKFAAKRRSPFVKNYLNADIGWISAALVDSQRACELISLNIKDIDLRYLVTSAKTRMGLTVGWLQIDYQDNDEREPVILSPTPTGLLSPVIQTLVVKDNLRSETDTLSFDFIDIFIAEFDFTLEERLLIDLMQFLSSLYARQRAKLRTNTNESIEGTSVGDRIKSESSLMLQNESSSTTSFASILMSTPNKTGKREKIYIKELVIGVIKVNISYLKGRIRDAAADSSLSKAIKVASDELFQRFFYNEDNSDPYLVWSQSTFDDDLHTRSEENAGSQNLQYFVARLFPNISDAPLRLPGKSVKHQFETATDVVENIFKFYSTEALKQFYKIVGALDIVGNPTMLVTSLVSGIRDFVLTPSTALMNSPTDPSRLGIGVAQGTLSFLSHGASGIFGYASKVAAAAGQGIASISMDNEFRDWHNDKVVVAATNLNREWKRRGVQSIGHILTQPIADIVLGFAGGISGVVISPIKGFQRNGSTGFVIGIAAGFIGIVAKPLVGLLDAATHFSASIHDIAKSVNVLDRRLQPVLKLRFPYTFGLMSVLAPFNANDARATQILKKCPLKEGYKDTESGKLEHIINVEILPSMGTEVFVIVTTLRVLLVRVKREAIGVLTTTICLEIYFSDDALYSSKVDDYGHSSVALIVYKRSRDKSVRSESKRTGILFALSPQIAWKTVTSRLGGLASPDQGAPSQVDIGVSNFDPDDITGTDDEGTLIDKFTILADYQYQRELTRLHNVISCLLGNYHALTYDKWLSVGRQYRTDGYTSFGMYFFEQDNPDIETNLLRPAATLTMLPWVGYHTFSEMGSSTVQEQIELLKKLREERSLTKEIEAAQWEGGPAWLVSSLANATFETYTYAATPLHASSSESLRITNANSSGAYSQMLTLADSDNNATSMTLYDPRAPSEISNTTNSVRHFDSTAENLLGSFQSPTVASSSIYRDARQSERGILKSSTYSNSNQSFHTAYTSPYGEGTDTPSQSMRNSVWMSAANESVPNDAPMADPSHLFSNTEHVTTIDTGEPKTKHNDASNLDSNRRLDRMEQLMERLLVFTADQTLLRHPPTSRTMMMNYTTTTTATTIRKNDPPLLHVNDTGSQQQLLNEIAELRAMLLQQTQQLPTEGLPPPSQPSSTRDRNDPNDNLQGDELERSSGQNFMSAFDNLEDDPGIPTMTDDDDNNNNMLPPLIDVVDHHHHQPTDHMEPDGETEEPTAAPDDTTSAILRNDPTFMSRPSTMMRRWNDPTPRDDTWNDHHHREKEEWSVDQLD